MIVLKGYFVKMIRVMNVNLKIKIFIWLGVYKINSDIYFVKYKWDKGFDFLKGG